MWIHQSIAFNVCTLTPTEFNVVLKTHIPAMLYLPLNLIGCIIYVNFGRHTCLAP